MNWHFHINMSIRPETLHIRSVLMNSRAGLFQFMKNGSGEVIIMGIERKYKSYISITEEKDKDHMKAQDIETDM